jgi:hypothetical protein
MRVWGFFSTLEFEFTFKEEDSSVPGTAEEFRLLNKLQKRISYFHKGKSGKNPLMMFIKVKLSNLFYSHV